MTARKTANSVSTFNVTDEFVGCLSQEKDTLDVIFLGSSHAYLGIQPMQLWEEYGIASYNLCSAEQPFWVSYYTIKEALKTQHPKVILLDAKPAIYTRDYSKRGRTILSTYGIKGMENRVGAILACVENVQDAVPRIPRGTKEIGPVKIRQIHGRGRRLNQGNLLSFAVGRMPDQVAPSAE